MVPFCCINAIDNYPVICYIYIVLPQEIDS